MSSAKAEPRYPIKRIVCLEDGVQESGPSSCLLSRDLKLSYEALEAFSWTNLSPVDVDLLLLAGLVAYADRNNIRRNGIWVRNFQLELPVHEPDFWASSSVSLLLSELLRFSTGDFWTFKFRPRRQRDERALRLPIQPPINQEPVVLPFSGGLDSFTELRLFPIRHPGKFPLLVTTVHNNFIGSLINFTSDGRSCSRLRVPIEFPVQHHSEPSFRTRTFLFFTVAAVAAKLAGSKLVLIPESGQGAIGPSLIPCGGEHPLQSSHPGFSYRLSLLLRAVWGERAPNFHHGNLWLTKAQVLREAEGAGVLSGWQKTCSCCRTVKRHKGAFAPRQCEVCGGCLLRRLALFAGGITTKYGKEVYLWQHLEEESLEASVDEGLRGSIKETTRNDRLIAIAAALDHRDLAAVPDFPENSSFRRAVREISCSTNEPEPRINEFLRALLLSHRNEWSSFIKDLGPTSWLTKLAESNL